jgi:hypothetical protein
VGHELTHCYIQKAVSSFLDSTSKKITPEIYLWGSGKISNEEFITMHLWHEFFAHGVGLMFVDNAKESIIDEQTFHKAIMTYWGPQISAYIKIAIVKATMFTDEIFITDSSQVLACK